jgi:hypothetical protein
MQGPAAKHHYQNLFDTMCASLCFAVSACKLLGDCRPGLQACVPVPANELVQFNDDDPAWAQHPGIAGACFTLTNALEGLTKPAKQ